MNQLARRKLFDRADVAACRAAVNAGPQKGKKLATIDRLFAERVGVPLDKPGLGRLLVDIVIDPNARRKPGNRPIVRFLQRVAAKSVRNFQPVTQEDWESNQRSGYLGTLQPAAQVARRARMAKRRRQRSLATRPA